MMDGAGGGPCGAIGEGGQFAGGGAGPDGATGGTNDTGRGAGATADAGAVGPTQTGATGCGVACGTPAAGVSPNPALCCRITAAPIGRTRLERKLPAPLGPVCGCCALFIRLM